jgi:Permeases of the drug/metabolite transporter (DMT) superfamily
LLLKNPNEELAYKNDDVLVIDRDLKGIDYKLAQCCHPIYGDLKEKLGNRFIPWSILALIAGYIMTFGFGLPNLSAGNYMVASFYAVLAAFSFGSATVFGKFVLNKWSFKTALFYRYGFTTVIMSIIVIVGGGADFSAVTSNNWLILIITTFTTGAFAIALYYYGLKYISAHVATMCELAFPVSSAILDYFINKSILSPVQWISAGVMLFAIYRLTKNQMQNQD